MRNSHATLESPPLIVTRYVPASLLGSPPRASMFARAHATMTAPVSRVPHFHAVYGEHEATVEIESERVHGRLPPRVLALTLEWASLHRTESLENWRRARAGESLNRVAPLE